MKPFQLKYRVGHEYGEKHVTMYHTEIPSAEAQFALDLIRHFAIIAAQPDYEDSAGRSKLALQPPKDLVRRAFDIAQAAYEEMANRSLYITVPDLNDINKSIDEKMKAKEGVDA